MGSTRKIGKGHQSGDQALREDWRTDPLEHTPPVHGSGNFLKDRGYPNPEQTRIKFDLLTQIRAIVESRRLRQTDIADRVARHAPEVDLSRPDISRILRRNVNGYPAIRLSAILAALRNSDV